MSAPPTLRARRDLLAILMLLALLVRPRGCANPVPVRVPLPATAVQERSGRLERAVAADWRGHTAAAAAAEGPPYCWWALDAEMLEAMAVPPATAAKLLRHMEQGGRPDTSALREEAGLAKPQAERWGPRFTLACSGRDFARSEPSDGNP